MRVAVERNGGRDAEATGDDAPGALGTAQSPDALLLEIVDRAAIVAARGEQALLALEDHREVGRQIMPGVPFLHRPDTEHHPQAMPVGVWRTCEAHAQAAAARARAAVAFELAIVPVDVEVHGAADDRAQVAVTGGQAAVRGCGSTGRRRRCRR